MKIRLVFLLIFCWQLSLFGQGQVDSTIWVIETIDGNEFVGIITQQDSLKLILQTEQYATLTIPLASIKVKKPMESAQLVDGEYWFDNPHATRYFWGPNGYGLKKGEGYYQNTWILFNQVSYGFTDNFTMGFGVIPIFLLGAEAAPVWITPKFSFPIVEDKVNIGAGGLFMTIVGETEEVVGIVYGTSTYGSLDGNFTAGLGYGFIGNEWADYPAIMFSGLHRTGKNGYLLTENYLLPQQDGFVVLISAGGRWVGKRIAIDYGGILPFSSYEMNFIVLPWLSINLPIGKKR